MIETPFQDHFFWLNHTVRTIACWVYLFIMVLFTIFHSFRMYHSQSNMDKSKGKLCKIFTIKRISYIIIACAILVILNQVIMYTPTQFRWIMSDPKHWMTEQSCKLTIFVGALCITTSKLALYVILSSFIYHLFHEYLYKTKQNMVSTLSS